MDHLIIRPVFYKPCLKREEALMNREDVEEIKLHFGVVAEGLERRVQQVAEGVANVDEKLDQGALRILDWRLRIKREPRNEIANWAATLTFRHFGRSELSGCLSSEIKS